MLHPKNPHQQPFKPVVAAFAGDFLKNAPSHPKTLQALYNLAWKGEIMLRRVNAVRISICENTKKPCFLR
jgi:hypothetical protein